MPTPLDNLREATEAAQKKRRRPAKTVEPPDDVERYYQVQMRSLVRSMMRSVNEHVPDMLKREKKAYTADGWDDEAEGSLQAASAPFYAAAMESQYRRLASEFVNRTVNDTTTRLVRSVRGSVGVDLGPIYANQPMNEYIRLNIEQNVSLIKTSVRDDFFKSVRTAVYEGMTSGRPPTVIAGSIQDAMGVTRRKGELIARDQVSRITGQVNKRRQEQAGIKYFKWVTSRDSRVGDDHRAVANRDIGYGKGVFKWDQPPPEGTPGNASRPNCRCTASPVWEWEVDG